MHMPVVEAKPCTSAYPSVPLPELLQSQLIVQPSNALLQASIYGAHLQSLVVIRYGKVQLTEFQEAIWKRRATNQAEKTHRLLNERAWGCLLSAMAQDQKRKPRNSSGMSRKSWC